MPSIETCDANEEFSRLLTQLAKEVAEKQFIHLSVTNSYGLDKSAELSFDILNSQFFDIKDENDNRDIFINVLGEGLGPKALVKKYFFRILEIAAVEITEIKRN
jgi:hypothetical protein